MFFHEKENMLNACHCQTYNNDLLDHCNNASRDFRLFAISHTSASKHSNSMTGNVKNAVACMSMCFHNDLNINSKLF